MARPGSPVPTDEASGHRGGGGSARGTNGDGRARRDAVRPRRHADLRPESEPRERDLSRYDTRTDRPDPWGPSDSSPTWRDPSDPSDYRWRDPTTGRRTVTITGRGAEAYAWRNGFTPSRARRRSHLKRYQRPGFRPDRVAFWAVLLGVLLILAAATSTHAAVLVTHHFLSLR